MSKHTSAPPTGDPLRIREGLPFPLGATWDGLGVNFALFSANATKVELCLFDGPDETRLSLPGRDDGIWHAFWLTEFLTAAISLVVYHKSVKLNRI